MSWTRYLHSILTLPPPIAWRKVRRRIGRQLRQCVDRLQARLMGSELSDADFLRSLNQGFLTITDFLQGVAARQNHHFFVGPNRQAEYLNAIRTCCPQVETRTIAAADQVCEHTFDLLGSGPTHLGQRIDWHLDFKTGYRWNHKQYYADICPAPYPGGYDIKVPWELSRCQHFAWLGQAYWFTGDEKYAQEFTAQSLDWIEQNPPRFGVNWVCTMDVAIRAVNWLWGYHYFKESPSLTDEFRLAFFKSLLAHGRHIRKNLEWSETLTSNHYLSNIVGLVYLGILLAEFKEAQDWRDFGLGELQKEMFKQVYPDGVDFEASVSYHRLVTELFLSAILLGQLNDWSLDQPVLDRLELMLEFIMHITKPDGRVPLIGDNDNGRLHRLKAWGNTEQEWLDHRYLLAIGAVLFGRDDFAQAAGDQWEEAIWLFGAEALRFKHKLEARSLPPAQPESRAFSDAGLYILHHDGFYMVVDAGPNGQNGNGGHAHNDVLSFELYAFGQTWIVDPGTHVYTAAYESRNLFRSTAYHNTVMVDGQEQNRFDEQALFRMVNDAKPEVLRWETTGEYDIFMGEHRGYTRLEPPVIHRRQIYFDKLDKFWWIRDIVASEGKHRFDWHFNILAPDEIKPLYQDTALMVQRDGAGLLLMPLPEEDIPKLSVQHQGRWISTGYGTRGEQAVVKYSVVGAGNLIREWLLYPFRGDSEQIPPIGQIHAFREKASLSFDG